ncbi:hypothetical protein KO527_14425 [Pseudoalteromonas sp. C2R02]|uniref:hypothetical protein n=1 Tax=Pseudoalteromonas sp. C2R02 TaxID=2841565 RepID=UPI001C091052|nr:hypothetical protein [Pseudoalteromonas sp. C2R02]MBU2970547.1 hypothetical protein [Pseudoalteromonas sp. C2R02]
MNPTNEDKVCTLSLERFDKQRLHIIRNLKDKVDKGELLSDLELVFLEQVFKDAHELLPKVKNHPEYTRIFSQAISLYHEINDQMIENTKI